MALNRSDSCRHFMDGATFVKCLSYYAADYSSLQSTWEITVVAADLGGNTNPTDAQIQAIADARALSRYTSWKASIDADTITETTHEGQAGAIAA